MKVLNFGSLNFDYVYQVDHMVLPGETLTTTDMQVFCGGKGLNQSVALAKAGITVCHGGMVGEDGRELLKICEEHGVATQFIRQIPGKSGHTIIQVDKSGQNCILLYGGANRSLTREYVDEVLAHFAEGDLLLLQNEVNELSYIIEQAYKRGMLIALNPSPFDDYLKACDLNKISIFLMNEIEGEQITGISAAEPGRILEFMSQKYPKAKIVLTLGKDGVMYREADEFYRQASYKVQTVDTTAAGDTFTGYFLAGLMEGMQIPDILRRSAMASAIAVTRSGAVPSIPAEAEVALFAAENK
nr:ribokinase [uncultured Clostridium sp.]